MNLNEISIRTNKGEYRAGETIYGAVYLLICSPCPCSGVKIKFKGYEKCSWEISQPEEIDGKWQEGFIQKMPDPKVYFKASIVLADYPNGIPMGQHCFPFKYPLQSGLPGSFKLENEGPFGQNWEAMIQYTVKAELDMPGVSINNLSVTQPIIIYNEAPRRDVETLEYVEKSTVKLCCCIPRGDVMVRSCLDKKSYESGSKGIVHVFTHNDSSVDIDYFCLTLNQVIILGDNSPTNPNRKVLTQSIFRTKYDGCPKGKSMQSDAIMNLQLEDGTPIQPSVEGSLIKCRYHADIEMQVKWAPGISIQPIVHIVAPKNKEWQDWHPPQWAKRCQLVVTNSNPCAVAQSILSSEIFASIPGFEIPL